MTDIILIISDNLPYAESLARAFVGNPLAQILSKHGDNFSILCPQTDGEIAQVVNESTIRLVIVDASAGDDMFNRFVQLQRDGVIPRGVGLIVLGGLSSKKVMQDSFTLDFPANLDELAKLIDATLERPPSEWIKRENAAINRQRYSKLHAQVHSLKHRFDGQVNSRSISLNNLGSWETVQDKYEELREIIIGEEPTERWVSPFLDELASLRERNPEFSQNTNLKTLCDGIKNALQKLLKFTKYFPVDTPTDALLTKIGNEFYVAMDEAAKKFEELATYLSEESAK